MRQYNATLYLSIGNYTRKRLAAAALLSLATVIG